MDLAPIVAIQDLQKSFDDALPKGLRWIDDARFLVCARPSGAAVDAPEQLLLVDARTGDTEPLFDAAAMIASLRAALDLDEAGARAVASRKDLVLRPGNAGAVTVHEGRLVALDFAAATARVLVVKGTSAEPAVQGPQFAPDGATVAFVRDHDLHVVPFDGGAVRRLTDDGAEERLNGRLDWVYQEEIYGRGTWDGFWWSPDGTRLAFLQLDESPVARYPVFDHVPVLGKEEVWRYPKAGEPNPVARVGCVDVVGGPVTWMRLDDPVDAWIGVEPRPHPPPQRTRRAGEDNGGHGSTMPV